MIVYGRRPVLMDASVLARFLFILRADLLSRHPHYYFLVTNHVHRQFRDWYPDHCDALAETLQENHLESVNVNSAEELQTFTRLRESRTLAAAECAAVATAHHRRWPLAIEDAIVGALAETHQLSLSLENTASLMGALVRSGAIQLSAADEFKKSWEQHGGSWSLSCGGRGVRSRANILTRPT